MHVVVAGASGFLGTHVVEALRARDHRVTRLVRRPAQAADESEWDPYADRLDQDLIDRANVVVNLAGSPLVGNPHSKKWARELVESRVATTRVLADAVARSVSAGHPTAYLAGNGISIHGDHGDEPIDESAESRGDALLTGVCQLWRDATEPAVQAGARVVVLHTAPVIDRSHPPLKQMQLPFRLGLGAKLGGGSQFFPVISLRDWVGAVVHLAEHDSVAGPANLCCPVTPTNAEWTQALAAAFGRRARLSVPSFALRRAAGPMAPEVLGSLRTEPATLTGSGFEFSDRDVRDVVAQALHP